MGRLIVTLMKQPNPKSNLAVYLSWITASILALVPFHAFLTTWAGSNAGHLDAWRIWKDVILAIILTPGALWLAWRSKPLRGWLFSSWISRLFAAYEILFFGMGAWAFFTDRVTASALIYSLIINLRFFAFFLVCVIIASQAELLRKSWQKILLLPAGLVLLFGLFQRLILPADFLRHFGYGPTTIPAFQEVDVSSGLVRIQSTLRGANPLGAYLVLLAPVLLILRQKTDQIILGFMAGLVLFYTYSRSAAIGAVIALLILGWIKTGGSFKRQWALLSGGILVVLALGSFYLLRSSQSAQKVILHTSKGSTSSVSSNEARLNSIKSASADIWHNPLGSGPGTAGPASFRNNNKPRIAENYYLQIGQEVGLAGMAIFAAINVLVAAQLWQRRKDNLEAALFASLIGLTFVNMLSHAWADDTLAYLWWGLAGIACSPVILNNSRHKHDGQNNKT